MELYLSESSIFDVLAPLQHLCEVVSGVLLTDHYVQVLVFEPLSYLRNLLEHLKVGYLVIDLHEVLLRYLDSWVQQRLLEEQVYEVVVELSDALAEVYHIVPINRLLFS